MRGAGRQDPTTQSLCFGEYDVSSDEGRKGEHFQRSGNALPIVDLPCAEQGCGTAKLVGNKWYNETDRNGTQLDHSVCRPCVRAPAPAPRPPPPLRHAAPPRAG